MSEDQAEFINDPESDSEELPESLPRIDGGALIVGNKNRQIVEDEFVDWAGREADEKYLETAIRFTTPQGKHVNRPNRFRIKKRSKAEVMRDRVIIAELWVKGWSQLEIAEFISEHRSGYDLSYKIISREIQEILKDWRRAYVSDANELKYRELAKLDRLEQEYWFAWERSLEDIIKTEVHKTDDHSAGKQGGISNYRRDKKVEYVERGVGNEKYLRGIERCIELRSRILGLFVEKKATLTFSWREKAQEEGIDPDRIVDDIAQQFIDSAFVNPAGLDGGGARRSLAASSEGD